MAGETERTPHVDPFAALFARSVDTQTLYLNLPIAAPQTRAEAQVSPLGPRTAGQLTESARTRRTATDQHNEEDLRLRREAGSREPKISEQLANDHRARIEHGDASGTAARSVAGMDGGKLAHLTAERSATNQQQSDPGSQRGGENRAASAQGSGSPNSNGTGEGGRSPGQSATPQGNSLAAQAQAPANSSAGAPASSTSSAQAIRAGGPTAAPAGGGGAQGSAGNFAQALGVAQTNRAMQAHAAQRGGETARLAHQDPKPVLQGVARGLFAAVRQNGGSLTMRLHPASLGQIRIHMSIQGSAVTAVITTTTEEAQRLLSEQLSTLRSALESKGLTVSQLNINHSPPPTSTNATQQDQTAEERTDGGTNLADDAQQGDTNDETDDNEQHGGGSFTWHIPVPDSGAERTVLTNGYVVSALNVVA